MQKFTEYEKYTDEELIEQLRKATRPTLRIILWISISIWCENVLMLCF